MMQTVNTFTTTAAAIAKAYDGSESEKRELLAELVNQALRAGSILAAQIICESHGDDLLPCLVRRVEDAVPVLELDEEPEILIEVECDDHVTAVA